MTASNTSVETIDTSKLTRETLALVLAGGRGSRLHELCERRAKPAVFFGGKFRIIDFALSNCINSGVRKIGVLTQYKAHSLIRHLNHGWNRFQLEMGEILEILPASQRLSEAWYEGTADAIWQNTDIIESLRPELVLVLAGDHIYKMDYRPMLRAHMDTGADITVGCIDVPLKDASSFGVMGIGEDNRIVRFDEKPATPFSIPGKPDHALASMGIYVFRRETLFELLATDAETEGSSRDFGRDIIPASIDTRRVMAFPFREGATGGESYWRDVGTVDAFWEANLELVDITPVLNLYDEQWPILTHQRQLPPAKFVFDDEGRRGMAVDSMVSGGCIISGASLKRTLLFSDVAVRDYSELFNAVVLPDVEIGMRCRISNAIIDRGCRIPDDTVIGEDREADARRFRVTERGVTLVTPTMLGQEPHHYRRHGAVQADAQ